MYIMLVFYRHMNEIKVYIYILLVNRHCVQKYIFILIKLKKKTILFYLFITTQIQHKFVLHTFIKI